MKFKTKNGTVMLIESNPNGKGWIVTRPATGSQINLSKKLVEKTKARLLAQEEIPFRSINYTVAIESAVLYLLKNVVRVDESKRVYVKR